MKTRAAIIVILAPHCAAGAEPESYVVENAVAISEPLVLLTSEAGGGAALYHAHGCADCHEAGDAPRLGDAGLRLTEGEIRLMIVEPRIVYPESGMPAYYTPGRLGEAPEALVGRTWLTAEEVERLVAWLARRGAE